MNKSNEEKILDILAGMQGSMLNMSSRMDSMENEVLKLNIWKETEFEAKYQALLDGQAAILEQLTPRSRIDDMENEIRFLKTVIQQMGDDIQKLKKAQ